MPHCLRRDPGAPPPLARLPRPCRRLCRGSCAPSSRLRVHDRRRSPQHLPCLDLSRPLAHTLLRRCVFASHSGLCDAGPGLEPESRRRRRHPLLVPPPARGERAACGLPQSREPSLRLHAPFRPCAFVHVTLRRAVARVGGLPGVPLVLAPPAGRRFLLRCRGYARPDLSHHRLPELSAGLALPPCGHARQPFVRHYGHRPVLGSVGLGQADTFRVPRGSFQPFSHAPGAPEGPSQLFFPQLPVPHSPARVEPERPRLSSQLFCRRRVHGPHVRPGECTCRPPVCPGLLLAAPAGAPLPPTLVPGDHFPYACGLPVVRPSCQLTRRAPHAP